MTKVYVVTNTQLGWDCVVGVYEAGANSVEYTKLLSRFPQDDCYVITECGVETKVEDEDD